MALQTDQFRKAALFGVALGMQAEKSFKDGFQPLKDLPTFIDELLMLPDIIENRDAILQQAMNLSPEDRDEVVRYVAENLDLENDTVELIVEEGWRITTGVLIIAGLLKNRKQS